MDNYVFDLFQTNKINEKSLLIEFNGIGEYIYKRLKKALRINGNMTVSKFLKKFKDKTSKEIMDFLKLALQNKRKNQCVSSKYNSKSYKKYHTRDVNKRSYNICLSILRYAKRNLDYEFIFTGLRNAVDQAEDTKHCGCLTSKQCRSSRICENKQRYCVPKNKNSKGFEGASKTGQKEVFRTLRQKEKIIENSKIDKNRNFYKDSDSKSDDNLSFSQPKYVTDENVLWRKSGKTLRNPMRNI
tara:strand:- start:5753 stop:6478 length:726 start_codon:yes stop_codon:yes gene_type:complete